MRTELLFPFFFAVLLALGLTAILQPAQAAHSGNVIYVNVNATAAGAKDGSSWTDA